MAGQAQSSETEGTAAESKWSMANQSGPWPKKVPHRSDHFWLGIMIPQATSFLGLSIVAKKRILFHHNFIPGPPLPLFPFGPFFFP